jgi:mycothiol synthase
MLSQPRPYHDEYDLSAMLHLLQAGRKAENGTYYVHPGDLTWWLYYPPIDHEHWQDIYLWDDPASPGRLLGWSLLSPTWSTFDVYVQPELRGTPQAEAMYLWAEERAANLVRTSGADKLGMMWVSQGDDILDRHLRQRGFQRKHETVYFLRSLEEELPRTILPDGFNVRSTRGEVEVEARAAAQYAAFDSSASFDRYVQRFTRFMRSPVYDPDLDIVAATPEGKIGAFCIVWPDSVNQVGLFEPVGTHPDYQRKGLGRAVMLEGLRRLQQRGMSRAMVCTGEDNLPGVKLYESMGFHITNKLGHYEKTI